MPSGGEDMDAGIGAEMYVEEEWESESSATGDSDMTARGYIGDQLVSGSDVHYGSCGVGDAGSSALEDQALEASGVLGASPEEVMMEFASHSLQQAQPVQATHAPRPSQYVLSVPEKALYGESAADHPQLKQVQSLYAPRLPKHLLSVPEGSITGDTAAIRHANVRKYFSLSGAVIAVRHVRKDQVDEDVFEVEFATAAFLEKALMKEIAPGIFPIKVVPTPDPAAPTSTVKVLGVPPEACTQSLREAMVHHGTVQSARLTPTKSGVGFIGYVTYQSSASGKEALEARYGFHGKEQIRIVHPAVTKEMESATPRPQLRLTNLPPNTTDWELLSLMTEVQAVNWHVPRIPQEGMTHLHSCFALVEFPNSVICQQVEKMSYQLRGYNLLWYHPSVTTCYRCGGHGHLQASCPVKAKVAQGGRMGACQDGVSYATAVQPVVNATIQQKSQLHTSSATAQPTVLADEYSGQATAAWLDALELQIGILSKSFQVLLT